MRTLIFVLIAGLFAGWARGAIQTRTVEYTHGDVVLEGYLAWDDSTDAKRPAVIVVHEWWGNNDYSRTRAEQLAQLGYVGFAIDMYGKGKTTTDAKQAAEWATAIRSDGKTEQARLKAGLETLKAQPQVDPDKIAAIGYCFGGSCALTMARNNMPVLGVVSFHGALAGGNTENPEPIKPKILVCHGADDEFEPQEQILRFMDEMRKAKADWQMIWYGNAVHSFTNPNADKAGIPGVSYNREADVRSWEAMKNFLADLFK